MANKNTLESLRKKIDEIDAQLINSISERARCAQASGPCLKKFWAEIPLIIKSGA